jgi:hypothetical protein
MVMEAGGQTADTKWFLVPSEEVFLPTAFSRQFADVSPCALRCTVFLVDKAVYMTILCS